MIPAAAVVVLLVLWGLICFFAGAVSCLGASWLYSRAARKALGQ